MKRSQERCGSWRRTFILALVGAIAPLASQGCGKSSQFDHQKGPEATTPSATASTRPPRPRCDVVVWVDLAAAKRLPNFAQVREKLLGSTASEVSQMIRLSELDIENYSDSATMCILPGEANTSSRVMTIEGAFPPEALTRLAELVPEAGRERVGDSEVLARGRSWIGWSSRRLLLADTHEALVSGLAGDLTPADLERSNKMLSVRVLPGSSFGGIGELTRGLRVDPTQWDYVAMSMTRDGLRAELIIMAKSSGAATVILDGLRTSIEELRGAPRAPRSEFAQRLTVEADGNKVRLEFAGSLDQLIAELKGLHRAAPHHRHN